jgi:hypothetical protein
MMAGTLPAARQAAPRLREKADTFYPQRRSFPTWWEKSG